MTKREVGLIFSVCGLAILLILSLILGFNGYLFSVSYINSNSDLKIGENVVIKVEPNSANVVSFTFDGALLPNEVIPQIVQINANDLNADVWVRVKSEIFGIESEAKIEFITTEHFEKDEDGYYYFDDALKGGRKITFCNYLLVPKNITLKSGEKYILSLVVETLETKNDINIWKNVQQS